MRRTILCGFLLAMMIPAAASVFPARPTSPRPAADKSGLILWYRTPARADIPDEKDGWKNDPQWLKALPVGNGPLGAMVFGDVDKERIQLNEESVWSGGPADNDNPDAYPALAEIRRLLWAGKYREATELTNRTQICRGPGSGEGQGAKVPFGCYQTLGDLRLDFGTAGPYSDYRRELDLADAIVRVSYLRDGVHFRREVFASHPDNVIAVRFEADKRGAISFRCTLDRPERFATVSDGGSLMMTGILDDGRGGKGLEYTARLKAVNEGGSVGFEGRELVVRDADAVTLLLSASTDFDLSAPGRRGREHRLRTLKTLEAAASKPYAALRAAHTADYKNLFDRVGLDLGGGQGADLPTDERLAAYARNPFDHGLVELYFQFGRYLLISSSRPGSLPANLQGRWANKIQTPWNCDYHTDINVQMNYWPAETTNLAECQGPLTDLIESLVVPGTKTARTQYHAAGWCLHPITNVWGFTAPGEHPGWGLHLGAGAWLCQPLWEHYAFSGDCNYLKRIYPVMKGSAQFYLDWLVEDPRTGRLVSGPASSPENTFRAPDGTENQISMGPSHDQEVIADLFNNLIDVSRALGIRDEFVSKVEAALLRLAVPGIGSDGRLMEWAAEFPEVEPKHRHVSHLFALHPGKQITIERTPELAAAARRSLEARGDGGTGWSLAWKVNFWARLKEGDRALRLLNNLLKPVGLVDVDYVNAGGTYSNLFCAHPPFQIDGNFGAAAGIAEMLLQSQNGDVELLPALSAAWPDGSVRGLCARGGFVVNLRWAKGALVNAHVLSRNGGTCRIRYRARTTTVETKPGAAFDWAGR